MTWLLLPRPAARPPRRRPPPARRRPAARRGAARHPRRTPPASSTWPTGAPLATARRDDRARARRAGRAPGWSCAADDEAARRRAARRLRGRTWTRPTTCCPRVAAPGRRGRARPTALDRRARQRGAGLERGRAAARPARRAGARRHAAPGGPRRAPDGPGRRPLRRARVPPPACAASTRTPARPTRGGRWWSSRSPPRRRCARSSPTRRCAPWPGLGGARPGHRRRGRPARPPGRPPCALGALPPAVTAYRRHPHCGCAWADDLGRRWLGRYAARLRHQYSLSSLPSMARRCSREQLSQ